MTKGQQTDVLSEVEGTISDLFENFGDGAWKTKLLIRDTIADITLQQVLLDPLVCV